MREQYPDRQTDRQTEIHTDRQTDGAKILYRWNAVLVWLVCSLNFEKILNTFGDMPILVNLKQGQ